MTIQPAGAKNRPRRKTARTAPGPRRPAPHNRLDLSGQAFGRLTVVAPLARRAANGCVMWLCRCACGGAAEVIASNLRSGNTTSCGCVQVDRTREALHERYHGGDHE